jgi:hypothetical protein
VALTNERFCDENPTLNCLDTENHVSKPLRRRGRGGEGDGKGDIKL